MDRVFVVLASLFGLLGVAIGAFGSHALRGRLTPERLAWLDTGVRYQLWHGLALFGVVLVRSVRLSAAGATSAPMLRADALAPWPAAAGWLFVAGTVAFSGSLYALALTGDRRWARVTPLGGVALLLGWLCLLVAVLTA